MEQECFGIRGKLKGRFPAPVVTWWHGQKLLDNTSHVLNDTRSPLQTINELVLGPLTRSLVAKPFTCRSKNNPLSPPLDRSVHVKIHSEYCRPQSSLHRPSFIIAWCVFILRVLSKDSCTWDCIMTNQIRFSMNVSTNSSKFHVNMRRYVIKTHTHTHATSDACSKNEQTY
ncbi:hypothetical protein E2C01_088955 [Portunus trituberculatus]|uniref:Ig-like domain-containing protein n=1 Tax=Portunus trituberculatus TaxID=210409 RepID=A0A5B7JHG1_PORTR|nr:hypothetical protein [Portunus trituberculatus]